MNGVVCYKYRSGSAALRSLSEGAVYFAPPQELNDCLEAKFDLAGPKEFAEVCASTLNELARTRGYTDYAKPISEKLLEELQPLNSRENNEFQAACKRVGIFSAASRPDNQPMWAYYCDNSRGVCFHFEWPVEIMEKYQLWPTQVTYSCESRIHNRAQDLRQLLLELGHQNPHWTMDQIMAFSATKEFRRRLGITSTARAVSLKHRDWAHECEVRLLAPRAGPIPVMQAVLKSVIFMRTDFPEWSSIMMLLHRLYPNVLLADMTFMHTEPFVRSRELVAKLVPIE